MKLDWKTRRCAPAILGVAAAAALPGPSRPATAQLRMENLTASMGIATEMYGSRDFSAITVPQIDSTESAFAGVGDMGMRGTLIVLATPERSLRCAVNGGMRQFVTSGFKLRNYAPRDLSGRVQCDYGQQFGGGSLTIRPTVDARHIADRPPLPIYLPPGFSSGSMAVRYDRPFRPTFHGYGQVSGEIRDFARPEVLPALDLLDRQELAAELGAVKHFPGAPNTYDRSEIAAFGAYRYLAYPKQGLGLLRRDNALQIGGRITLNQLETRGFQLELTGSGIRSRSNSRRVEYNAATLDTELVFDLGESNQIRLTGSWKAKRYITPQQALVPGEEADNSTSVAARITRFLDNGVRAALQGGWTRAETNVSGAYYERFSISFTLAVTPWP